MTDLDMSFADIRIDEVESLEIHLEPRKRHINNSHVGVENGVKENDADDDVKKMSLYRSAGQLNVTAKPNLFKNFSLPPPPVRIEGDSLNNGDSKKPNFGEMKPNLEEKVRPINNRGEIYVSQIQS